MKKHSKYLQVGLAWPTIVFLGALAIPKAVVNDFNLSENQPYLNALLSLAPGIIWVAYVLYKKVPKTFNTLLAVGLAYGLMLSVVHQLSWNSIWGGNDPQFFASIIPRFSNFIGSIITGLILGAVLGAVALFLKFLQGELTKRP